jgi:predicted methyltransferase
MFASVIAAMSVLAAAGLVQGAREGQAGQDRAAAEPEVAKLAALLEVEPGATVADVGAGFGAMTAVFAKWLGPNGRVFATDVGERQLAALREYVKREQPGNVAVIEGAAGATNLPEACCDAIFMRDVYHHLTLPTEFNRDLAAALKPAGRLAVIDFVAKPGSTLSPGVNPNRGGHGISPELVISEVSAAGLQHERTIDAWPDAGGGLFLVLFRK